jgi:hypothetical protein
MLKRLSWRVQPVECGGITMVYAVLYDDGKDWEICIVADNEMDIVTYLLIMDEIQFDAERFTENTKTSIQDWLDNGHRVDELNEWIKCDKFFIDVFNLGYDYRTGSPYQFRDISMIGGDN